jgi:hypothetical protein
MSGIIRASAAAGQVDAQAGHVACLWLCWRHYAVRLLNGRVGLLLGSMWCILRLGLLCSSSFAPPSLGSQGDQSISLQQSSGKHIVPRSGLKFSFRMRSAFPALLYGGRQRHCHRRWSSSWETASA